MTFIRALVLSCLCILFASVAFADSIPVDNPSFETLASAPLTDPCAGSGCSFEYLGGSFAGWTFSGGGLFQPGTSTNYFNSLPDGPTIAFANGGGTISQILGVTVQPDTTYTLDLDIGNRKNVGFDGLADLVIGGQSYQATGVEPISGDWGLFSATFTCDGTCSQVGDSIEILLSSSGVQGNFDNVEMFSSVPEPAAISLLSIGLLGLAVLGWRRKQGHLAL